MKDPAHIRKIQHLYSRAAFGISISDLQRLSSGSIHSLVDELFKSSLNYTPVKLVGPAAESSMDDTSEKILNQEDKKRLREERNRSMMDLNLYWLQKLYSDPCVLRERMTFFWHGHFACRVVSPYLMQELNNIHREHALGSFRDMLLAVSRSPAMLQFLNNQQNRKMHPNENFAREVMELFTLGRGNYTEHDIREGARAFTGWGFDRSTGEFVFRQKAHDEGEKTFLGKTGNLKGEDIIDILLSQKETARFISRKLYRFFVNDRADEARVGELADSFFESNYDIGALMKQIFTADWFYDTENIGVKIKSPVELIAGIHKLVPVSYENKDGLLVFQRALGQALFYPPNVSGWAGGKSWIDSSSLMFRLKVPSLILNDGHIEVQPKEDMLDNKPGMMKPEPAAIGKKEENNKKKLHAVPDWQGALAGVGSNCTSSELCSLILLPVPSAALRQSLKSLTPATIKEVMMEIMSSPEYQMA